MANNGANTLYQNDGDGTFSDVTSTAGVGDTGIGRGTAWADYDGDGDLDLYVSKDTANILYQNNGDGTFSDVTSTAGVGDTGNSRGTAWGDFDGDGDQEVAVAGGCWFSVFDFAFNGMYRYAMAQTKDWSSASTGSTVFDFNGDGASEVVFSDEEAVYVWGVDGTPGLEPWDRLTPYLVDTEHKSWTVHEYPLVADVDADGKAEIVVVNSHLPGYMDHFGLYVLGSANDDW